MSIASRTRRQRFRAVRALDLYSESPRYYYPWKAPLGERIIKYLNLNLNLNMSHVPSPLHKRSWGRNAWHGPAWEVTRRTNKWEKSLVANHSEALLNWAPTLCSWNARAFNLTLIDYKYFVFSETAEAFHKDMIAPRYHHNLLCNITTGLTGFLLVLIFFNELLMDILLLSDLPIHNDLYLLTVNSYQAFYGFSERDEASEKEKVVYTHYSEYFPLRN